jgi:DNA-binding NarL/FixJ family response regulator
MIAEDDVPLREGIARLLTEAEFEVVAQAGDADELLREGLAHRPDLLVADINMPPGNGADGLTAALELRQRRPETNVLILSASYGVRFAVSVIAEGPDGVGYLLKERVGDLDAFVKAADRVADGGSAFDAALVSRMLERRRSNSPLNELSRLELDVLAAMAEGKSNRGIAEELSIGPDSVEEHIRGILRTLGLDPAQSEHRRVLAVLTYLRSQ